MMNRTKTYGLVMLTMLACLPSYAQEQSVRPGINKSFEKPDVAKFVERFEREGREVYDLRKEIVDACNIKPGMDVADIGAGTGLFTRMFSPRVGSEGRVYAVDIAKEFVERIEKTCREEGLGNVTGVTCRQDSVELPADSIDLAFICDTYHHFEFPYKTMRSIRRALRPGGHVVLVEFHRIEGKSSDWILSHVRAGQETFADEILTAGFELVEERKFLKTSYWMRFRKSARKTSAGHTVDSIDRVKQLLENKTAMLIDVREQREWDAGHLQVAELVPLSTLRNKKKNEDFPAQMAKLLPKDKIIYCHCRSGRRVLAATAILEELGYDIRPLKSGFSDLAAKGFATEK